MDTRKLFVAALAALAVLAGSALLCVQARRAFDVRVSTDSRAGLELHVQTQGVASCVSHLLAHALGAR